MPLEMDLPKQPGLFITGTDTGVGKTLIAGAIANILASSGCKTGVFKPVATGCERRREGLVSSDAEFLAFCANSDLPLSVINPITYITPAAPLACEEFENRAVDFEPIAAAYTHICQQSDFVIVEGIGGVRVPVSDDVDVLDLACCFQLPVVIVARASLGTINHTLLTIDAIQNANLRLAGVVINGYDPYNATKDEETAPAIIARCGQTEILAVVSHDEESNVEQGLLGRQTIEILTDCDWIELAQM